jgi:hypothetical protein
MTCGEAALVIFRRPPALVHEPRIADRSGQRWTPVQRPSRPQRPGAPLTAPAEPLMMTEPPAVISGTACWPVSRVPRTFTPNTSSNESTVAAFSGSARAPMPAA